MNAHNSDSAHAAVVGSNAVLVGHLQTLGSCSGEIVGLL
jgi:hypothetical protein